MPILPQEISRVSAREESIFSFRALRKFPVKISFSSFTSLRRMIRFIPVKPARSAAALPRAVPPSARRRTQKASPSSANWMSSCKEILFLFLFLPGKMFFPCILHQMTGVKEKLFLFSKKYRISARLNRKNKLFFDFTLEKSFSEYHIICIYLFLFAVRSSFLLLFTASNH